MRFKTLPIFTLATYRMGSNFSIRVTPNINLITVGLKEGVEDKEGELEEEDYGEVEEVEVVNGPPGHYDYGHGIYSFTVTFGN